MNIIVNYLIPIQIINMELNNVNKLFFKSFKPYNNIEHQ